MTDAYHQLANVVEVRDASELKILRAKTLLNAIERHRDYSLIGILRHGDVAGPSVECLVVDVECDDVPPENSAGIQYRERLALCVPSDDEELVEVLALRKSFPILMHLNQGGANSIANLCLYFEASSAVRRTWTPQAFLRRIQWWLEKSARGELHPADQPVEHLFFASKYELVLPWNLAELRKDATRRFVVLRQKERVDGGFTCLLLSVVPGMPQDKTVKHIELLLPPIVHGSVERNPSTLGELADLLSKRNTDLIGPLSTALKEGIGSGGVMPTKNDNGTVILLYIPVRRTATSEPDTVIRRAFFIPISTLDLGVACGALMVYEGRYFQDSLNPQPSAAWREQQVMTMDVRSQNDAAAARRQSGITDAGPPGLLIGAGSLGSALLNLWGRSGWGTWTVIDKDHIKPHNLSRHAAYSANIGEAKAEVVAELHAGVMDGASIVTPIVADACDLNQDSVIQALGHAAVVIDASTTLEYPRLVSGNDTLPRHFSVFITPNGNAAVLLAEDAKRAHCLRTLEAQYYRALIQQEWGKIHLQGHTGTFWSGASCRDISLVLPYSRILGHASTLAEQIQQATASDNARIRIWQRNPELGNVDVHDIDVMVEQQFDLGELNLYIDAGAIQRLRDLRQQAFPHETGGALLGYYDFNIQAVVVVAGLPAPPDSKASPSSFERGTEGLFEAIAEASKRTGGMVRYIGEWHSHPPGQSASPSRDDVIQLVHLALGMADDGLPAVQLIVGETDVQVLQGAAG
ncbi:ThiF family adenylyltransferase [Herbaspirillum sp. 1130]|uniref:ThiF family adenylyltransferase n=1 Tax=Herbaspirillum sp. 1130 TaxID=2806562 RepID=UPI001AE9C456|nr:ThiF family adenylyltransferase [Herbaspirillum sp. 1130]MBP1312804.1 integrative and conjugative element protein (TIGR02256 family) [Herbaspirillum sp. 1130]